MKADPAHKLEKLLGKIDSNISNLHNKHSSFSISSIPPIVRIQIQCIQAGRLLKQAIKSESPHLKEALTNITPEALVRGLSFIDSKAKHSLLNLIDTKDKVRTLMIADLMMKSIDSWKHKHKQEAADLYAQNACECIEMANPATLLKIASNSRPQINLGRESRYENSIKALNCWLDKYTTTQAANYLCKNPDGFKEYLSGVNAPELKAVYERFAMSVFADGIENHTFNTMGTGKKDKTPLPVLTHTHRAYDIMAFADEVSQRRVDEHITRSIKKVYKNKPKDYAIIFAQLAVKPAQNILDITTARKTTEIILAHESVRILKVDQTLAEVKATNASNYFNTLTEGQPQLLKDLGIMAQQEAPKRPSITLEQMRDQT